jgi:hypothetical protein
VHAFAGAAKLHQKKIGSHENNGRSGASIICSSLDDTAEFVGEHGGPILEIVPSLICALPDDAGILFIDHAKIELPGAIEQQLHLEVSQPPEVVDIIQLK